MKITNLFYKILLVLGQIEHKLFKLLDQSTDSDKEYVIMQTENDGNLTLEDIEENSMYMQSISEHRFQNLRSVKDF